MDFLLNQQPLPMIQCLTCLQLETSPVTFDCILSQFLILMRCWSFMPKHVYYLMCYGNSLDIKVVSQVLGWAKWAHVDCNVHNIVSGHVTQKYGTISGLYESCIENLVTFPLLIYYGMSHSIRLAHITVSSMCVCYGKIAKMCNFLRVWMVKYYSNPSCSLTEERPLYFVLSFLQKLSPPSLYRFPWNFTTRRRLVGNRKHPLYIYLGAPNRNLGHFWQFFGSSHPGFAISYRSAKKY